MLIQQPTTKFHILVRFTFQLMEELSFLEKDSGLQRPPLQLLIHILPTYNPNVRFFIPSVTKKKEARKYFLS